MIYNRLGILVQDSNGGIAFGSMSTQNQTPLVLTPYAGLLSAYQNCTGCNIIGVALQTGASYSGSGSPGSYPLASDELRLQLQSGSSTGWINLPAPVNALFYAGGNVFNPGSSLITALGTQIFAVLGDPTGRAWSSISGGKYRQVVRGPGGQ